MVDEFGFTVIDQRKNWSLHLPLPNGLTKSIARIRLSIIPLRLDRWILSLWQRRQFIIAILQCGNSIAGQSSVVGNSVACPILNTGLQGPKWLGLRPDQTDC